MILIYFLILVLTGPLQGRSEGVEWVANKVGQASSMVHDLYGATDIVADAKSIISGHYEVNPAIRHKLARLTHKIAKELETLSALTRTLNNGGRKMYAGIRITKTLERIVLYVQEFRRNL